MATGKDCITETVLMRGHNVGVYSVRKIIPELTSSTLGGAPETQWTNCWPADLAVPGLILTGGENLFWCKWDSIAVMLSLSPSHGPNMTEIPLKIT